MAEQPDETLYDMLAHKDEYVPKAIMAAEQELRNRGLDYSEETIQKITGETAGGEEYDEDTSDYCVLLGTFDVSAAEEIMEQLEKEGVRFKVGEDDSPLRHRNVNAPLLDIYIHPDDEAKATKIIEGMSSL